MRATFLIFNLLTGLLIIVGCDNKKNTQSVEQEYRLGDKINLMFHAIELHNTVDSQLVFDSKKKYRIVTYGDLYCDPCFDNVIEWNKHYNDLKQYKNLSYLCYVRANKLDFDVRNVKEKLLFPVYLDKRDRFRIVNKIETEPRKMTLLLNEKNEVILAGAPFSEEMKIKYHEILSE